MNRLGNIISYVTDRVTHALEFINTDHAYIHEGIAFKAHLYVGDLAGAASVSFSFKTPTAKYCHFKDLRLISVGASVVAEIYRGTTVYPLVVDDPGDPPAELLGPSNVNDIVTTATGVVVLKTPTFVTAQAGVIWDYIINPGASTNQFQSVSDTKLGENYEMVMKPNTYYVIKITNLSVGGGDAASAVHVKLFWYEEDNG